MGCPTRDISKLDQTPSSEYRQPIDVSQNRNVDILFVVDNSDSMKEEQDNLAKNFPIFINVLNSIEGGLPSVHIGVVSSDLGIPPWQADQCSGNGDQGLLQSTPRGNCTGPEDPYIYDVLLANGQRDRNYTGDLAATFSCIAKLGITGCGAEMHLESMKLALDGSRPENQGFLRQDAYLAIIIMGDEDDCSTYNNDFLNPSSDLDNINSPFGPFNSFRCTEFGVICDGSTIARAAKNYTTCIPRDETDSKYMHHPQHYVDFLRQLKGNPNLLIAAVIAGNPTPFQVGLTEKGAPILQPSCTSANGKADPAVRLHYFAEQFGDHGTFLSICQNDFTDALTTTANLLKRVLGSRCLGGNIDTTDIDPATPGLQLDCNVSDVRFLGAAGSTEKTIARCHMKDANTPDTTGVTADNPCWWARMNPAKCPVNESPTQTELEIERGGGDAPVGTSVVARCVVKD
jgi:hypothetical protein